MGNGSISREFKSVEVWRRKWVVTTRDYYGTKADFRANSEGDWIACHISSDNWAQMQSPNSKDVPSGAANTSNLRNSIVSGAPTADASKVQQQHANGDFRLPRTSMATVANAAPMPTSVSNQPSRSPELSNADGDSWREPLTRALIAAVLGSEVTPVENATSAGTVRVFKGIEVENCKWTVATRTDGTGAVEMKAQSKKGAIDCQISATVWKAAQTQQRLSTKSSASS